MYDAQTFLQTEYQKKLRRDSRKLADQLHKAHKRHLLRESDNKFSPLVKIDIMPVEPDEEIYDMTVIKEHILHLLNGHRYLPVHYPISSINGLIVQKDELTVPKFDQLYIGNNGHIGLRSETLFRSDSSENVFNFEGAIQRFRDVLDISQLLLDQKYNKSFTIRLELEGIRDWSVYALDNPSYDEKSVAVLPHYVVEKEVPNLENALNTVMLVSTNMLGQLGISK